MRPEHFTRVYNGVPHLGDFASGKPRYPDARLFDKEEQLVQMAGRGFPGGGGGVGFHIELGERDADRRRAVYDSSDRDREWTEEGRGRGGEEGYTGIVSGRSEVSVSHSDGSEDYDEELDLEADGGRGIVTERGGDGVVGERASEVLQSVAHSHIPSQDGAVPPFQRMNADRGRTENAAVSAGQKFGMFSFLNSFSSPGAHNVGENGAGRESTENVSNGAAGVPDSMYFTSIVNSASGDIGVDSSSEKRSEYSVRHFLSDPISGALMEDAVILPCGHSVGTAGFQRVQETNACVVCMRPTAPMSAAPNHALRVAVHAFKREREFPNSSNLRSAKRRRERFEQDDQPFDGGKVKGVQFPYSVSDRVLIKGNKRTPERFVGREAIITTQCLNGWYLVRTTDNGESVRLQYRSLQKLGGQQSLMIDIRREQNTILSVHIFLSNRSFRMCDGLPFSTTQLWIKGISCIFHNMYVVY